MSEREFLTAEWRNLLLLNYEVARADLAPYVPAGTEIDDWHGRVLASVAAFQFLQTRIRGLSLPLHRDFEELNLRFYVRHVVGNEVRRGVVFLREIVPLPLVALVARLLYHEPYRTLPTRSVISAEWPPRVEYGWRAEGRWHSCSAKPKGASAVPEPTSLEAFIAEHYWGYGKRRSGETVQYRVAHPRWSVWSELEIENRVDFTAIFGPRLGSLLTTPVSAFLADGSPVTVFSPSPLTPIGRQPGQRLR